MSDAEERRLINIGDCCDGGGFAVAQG